MARVAPEVRGAGDGLQSGASSLLAGLLGGSGAAPRWDLLRAVVAWPRRGCSRCFSPCAHPACCCSVTPSSASCSAVQSPELRNEETETYFLRAFETAEGLSQAGPCAGCVAALWLLAQPFLKAGVTSARATPRCSAVLLCCHSLRTLLGSLRQFPRHVDFFFPPPWCPGFLLVCSNCVPLQIFGCYHLISSSQVAGRSQIVCRGSSSVLALLPQSTLRSTGLHTTECDSWPLFHHLPWP